MTEKPLLILASNSPRRRQLLSLTGWQFTVSAADVDESQYANESPADYVLRLAETKARAIGANANQLILAADTTVVDGADILGKPNDGAEAIAMLKRLRGHTHQVYTGIALFRPRDKRSTPQHSPALAPGASVHPICQANRAFPGTARQGRCGAVQVSGSVDGLLLKDLCVTDVPMRDYSDEEILAYVQTGDPLDKAGAYAIQHPEFQPVANLNGCFASVMGLPVCHVIRLMRMMDLQPATDFFLSCETLLEYRRCPVSDAILNGEM